MAVPGGDGNELVEGGSLRAGLEKREQRGLVLHPIHLVDHQDPRYVDGHHPLQHLRVLTLPPERLHHDRDDVDVAERAPRGAIHVTIERTALDALHTGGVDVDELIASEGMDAEQRVARRLRAA